jgi:hypothetical protein
MEIIVPNPKVVALAVIAALYLLMLEVTTYAIARRFTPSPSDQH